MDMLIRRNPSPEILGLSHIEDFTFFILKEVDSRGGGYGSKELRAESTLEKKFVFKELHLVLLLGLAAHEPLA